MELRRRLVRGRGHQAGTFVPESLHRAQQLLHRHLPVAVQVHHRPEVPRLRLRGLRQQAPHQAHQAVPPQGPAARRAPELLEQRLQPDVVLLQVPVQSAEQVQPRRRLHAAAPVPPHGLDRPRRPVLPKQAPGRPLQEELLPLVHDPLEVPLHPRRRLGSLWWPGGSPPPVPRPSRFGGAEHGPLRPRTWSAGSRALALLLELPLPRLLFLEPLVLLGCGDFCAHHLEGLHQLRVGNLAVAVGVELLGVRQDVADLLAREPGNHCADHGRHLAAIEFSGVVAVETAEDLPERHLPV